MRIGVMPRHGTAEDVTWIDTGEPCYAYHVVGGAVYKLNPVAVDP
jgi:carotenoid cleavage dioxygenase-like enzyme